MSVPNPALRREVIAIYKGICQDETFSLSGRADCSAELLNLGKDYPRGFGYFRPRLHRAFMANAHLCNENEIRQGIARAEFVRKGLYASLSTGEINTDVSD
jgi:hypothetical protein